MDIIWKGSPNYTAQNGVRKRYIVMHWMVGNLSSCDAAMRSSSRRVSAHYGIEGTKIHQYVKEKDAAWACGHNEANRYGISIEHSGGNLLSDGTRRQPSKTTHETSARLCAAIARRHKLGRLKVGVDVFPHNHFVATMCPGSLRIKWIVERANKLNGYE